MITLVIYVNPYTVTNKKISHFFHFCFYLSAVLIENLLIWVIQKVKEKDLTNVGGETIADIKNGDCLIMTDSLRNGL